jgi:hypothetical protein
MSDELNIGSVDLAGMQAETERFDAQDSGGGRFSNNDMFVRMPEKEGSVQIRILPPSKGHKLYCKTRVHKINGRNVHCLKTRNETSGKWEGDCPICGYYRWLYTQVDKLEAEGDMAGANKKRAEAKLIKPIERTYFNVIDREDAEAKPKILSVGVKLYAKIIRAFTGDKKFKQQPLGDITDWKGKTGRDLLIIKEIQSDGSNSYPNYDRSQFAEPSPLADKEGTLKLMEKLHDLSALRNVKTEEYVKQQLAIYRGLISDQSVGFNPDEFDNEFKGAETQTTATATSKVEEPVTAESLASAVAETNTNAEPEGKSVDVEDFYNELQGMGLDDDE